MKGFLRIVCLLVIAGGAAAAFAQQQAPDQAVATPRFDVSVGYNYIDANAPPSSCDCFGMKAGGYASANYNFLDWLGITGKFTGNHASDISNLGQDLTLMTFMAGPKFFLPYRRMSPFGDILFGGAHASDSYFPTSTGFETSATSFALSAGGGLDWNLTRRFAIRLPDVEYLRTSLPNGDGNTQNQLEISAGIVFHFGSYGRPAQPAPAAVPAPQTPEVALTCSANAAEVTAGDLVQVVASAVTIPANAPVEYTWTASGGAVQQTGHIVTIDTSGLEPGEYRVNGRVTLASDSAVGSDCTTLFRIKAAPAPTAAPVNNGITEEEFRKHIKDAFFDYDKYNLRPDAQQAVQVDIAYLLAHPDLQITIGGYADERGSAEFNLALGLNRAKTMRDALIAGGVDASRIVIISYGKEKQFCTATTDACYQLNRRAQIVLRK